MADENVTKNETTTETTAQETREATQAPKPAARQESRTGGPSRRRTGSCHLHRDPGQAGRIIRTRR